MTICDIIKAREITEILHFTTLNKGLTGILDVRMVKSRPLLKDNQRLEFILKLNTVRVLDRGWEGFVNLSISRVNYTLLGISANSWHPDEKWCILSFDPKILSHEGVFFATTNNAYPKVSRGQGARGLEQLFAQKVAGRYESSSERHEGIQAFHTTCPQAEVLYPKELPTSYLRIIYVKSVEDSGDVHGLLQVFLHEQVRVVIDPTKFG